MYTDPIADYLTRVRNASRAGHRVVEIPASKLKKEITKILFDQGYILRLNGLGIAIVSTSHGVMTGKQAQRENVGGEVLCYVY